MKPSTRIPLSGVPQLFARAKHCIRPISSTVSRGANVTPLVGTGPPPEPPIPETRNAHERVARRRKQTELLKSVKEIRNSKDGKTVGLRKRFWKDVSVQEVDDALQIHLDTRPLRHPVTKKIIRLPKSKTNLAWALALEWDVLTSALQATKQHLIPLTSLVCRALDIADDDAKNAPDGSRIRANIATAVLRYMDTDSILCWAPPASETDIRNDAGESLRDVQKRAAEEIVSFLTTHVWPGITITPVLDGHSIVPRAQAAGVREIVQGWIIGLSAWEIAGLERGVLAGKSLIAASRLVTEWTDGPVAAGHLNTGETFGVEQAARATNLEVDWQAQQWGEVEDTHDVNKEDLRRQLGSVVLLVSGDKST